MEFVSLHELSVELDTSVRVLRHRLHQLLQDGKLIEGQDCRRDDFVDATHFIWKIDPVAFMRVTGMRAVTKPVSAAAPAVIQSDNQAPPASIPPANPGGSTLPNVDSKTSGMEREMIDLLKEQIGVKDRQIGGLTEQNQKLNDLNVKLVGQSAHQVQRIETLLRLTGGKIELSEVVTKDQQPSGTAVEPGLAPDTSNQAA